jgi:hypothetical protein
MEVIVQRQERIMASANLNTTGTYSALPFSSPQGRIFRVVVAFRLDLAFCCLMLSVYLLCHMITPTDTELHLLQTAERQLACQLLFERTGSANSLILKDKIKMEGKRGGKNS